MVVKFFQSVMVHALVACSQPWVDISIIILCGKDACRTVEVFHEETSYERVLFFVFD